MIHTSSRGFPWAVDNLAVAAPTAAFAAGKVIVVEGAARAAVAKVTAG